MSRSARAPISMALAGLLMAGPAVCLAQRAPHAVSLSEEVPSPDAARGPGVRLLATGAAIFGGAYTISALSGILAREMTVPIAGPIWVAARLGRDGVAFVPWLVLDSLAQAGGLALLCAGALVMGRAQRQPGRVELAPYVGPGGAGVTAAIRF